MLIEVKCPVCGAVIKVDDSAYSVKCDYCGNIITLKKQDFSSDNASSAPKIEYSQVAPNYSGSYNTAGTAQYAQQPKRRRHTFLWILGWLFIFPVPLTILIARSKNINGFIKAGIIACAWLFFISANMMTMEEASEFYYDYPQYNNGTSQQQYNSQGNAIENYYYNNNYIIA